MDIQPQQPISDDQELAKVLAGITVGADQVAAPANLAGDLEQEATIPAGKGAKADEDAEETEEAPVSTPPVPPAPPLPPVPSAPMASLSTPSSGEGELESIKHDALNELRPLVDKLNVSPEEKFDTYLLLIRSTDDPALIGPAHDAAKSISDEARRAQALLDVIKEIDYLSGPKQQAA
jgi:hypothetical protein